MSSVVAWFILVYIQMSMLGNFVSSLSVQFMSEAILKAAMR